MNTIIQAIVNRSTLEVPLIKITNATKDSFLISMESKVANTGPVGSTMSPMTVDMCGVSGVFGRLNLPEIQTSPSGTVIKVADQKIQIIDMDAFMAFNKSIMADEKLILRLENGHATVKAWPFTASIYYQKTVYLEGMKGLKTIMTKTVSEGAGFKNTMTCFNLSPLEIDLGTVRQEIRNSKGVKIAEQKGKVYLTRGESIFTMIGTTTGVAADGDATLVCVGVEEDNWNNRTIINFNAPVTLTDEFVALCNGSGKIGKET